MKARFFIVSCFLAVLALVLSIPAPAQEQKQKSEKFSALAYMPHGAGPAMVGAGAKVNVDLWVNSYTTDAEAKSMAGALLEGGSEALLKVLEKKKRRRSERLDFQVERAFTILNSFARIRRETAGESMLLAIARLDFSRSTPATDH